MSSLLELEEKYENYLSKNPEELIKLYEKIRSVNFIDLKKKDVTKAILFRMRAYYFSQNKIKDFLSKRYIAAASDFFVETVAFYLKLILDIKKTGLGLHSERQIMKKRGSIRPDISIWKNEAPISIIECKTQLGWNRDRWEPDFIEREEKLKSTYPSSNAFLLVMSSQNWHGFPENNKVGNQYFTLSSVWPTDIIKDDIDEVILNPIEKLFCKIIS